MATPCHTPMHKSEGPFKNTFSQEKIYEWSKKTSQVRSNFTVLYYDFHVGFPKQPFPKNLMKRFLGILLLVRTRIKSETPTVLLLQP
jgi:hypothetical protein